MFLAALGYQAPGPYELFIASAPQVGLGGQLVRVWGLFAKVAGSRGKAQPAGEQVGRLGALPCPALPCPAHLHGLLAARGDMCGCGIALLRLCSFSCHPPEVPLRLQTTDLEQQEAMLADLEPPPRPQQAWAAGAAAAAAAAGSGSGVRATAARSAAVAAARHSFQALLQQSPGAAQQEQGEQQQAQSSAGGTVDMRGTAAVAAAAAAASPAWPARRAPTLPFESAAQPRRAAAAAAGSDDLWQHEPPRRSSGGGGHKSRWGSDEVSALIEGVALHGHSWARIHAEHVYGTRRIASHRGQVGVQGWCLLWRCACGSAAANAFC